MSNAKLVEGVQAMVANSLEQVMTAIPATISKVLGKNLIEAIPSIGGVNPVTGEEERLPTLVNVPVVFPFSGSTGIVWKLQTGSPVLIVFSKYSLDAWLQGNGEYTSDLDPRQFSLTDAIAIAGLYPVQNELPETDGILIQDKDTTVEIVNGKVKIGGDDLKKLVNEEFLSIFSSHTHTGGTVQGNTGAPNLLPAWDAGVLTEVLEAE